MHLTEISFVFYYTASLLHIMAVWSSADIHCILTKLYVFLVLFTMFHFDPEKLICKKM